MKTYVVTVILVCALGAIASLITPEGKMKKQVGFLISLMTLCAILAPLGNLTFEGDGDEWLEDLFPSYEGELGENWLLLATEEELRGHLCETFSLPREEVLVEVIGSCLDTGDVEIERVVVTLNGDSTREREGVRAYLAKHIFCEVEVHVGKTEISGKGNGDASLHCPFWGGASLLWLL